MSAAVPSIEVLATPWGLPGINLEDKFCVVVDVLRACTTMAYAFEAGARSVIPVESVEEATRLVSTLDRDATLLCGERDNVRIEGFDLGNSPQEYVAELVADKTLVLSTTNGARALAALANAKACVAASFVNLTACARRAASEEQITIVCAASGAYFALEDFVCAGHLVEEIRGLAGTAHRLDDGARTAVEAHTGRGASLEAFLRKTDHGASLTALGFGDDIALAAQVDRFGSVPTLRDGRVIAEPAPIG